MGSGGRHRPYAVQARPITVLDDHDGFDTPIDDHELTTGGIVEMVPGVLPALRWELNRFLLEEAFRSVLDSLGIIRGLAAEDRPFVRRVRGRAAIDFDQLRSAAAGIPGAVAELEYQYFGVGGTPPPVTHRRKLGLGDLRRDILTLRTRRTVIEQSDVLIQVASGLLRRRPTLQYLSTDDLVAYARRLVDVSGRGLAAELGVAAASAAAYTRLEGLLTRHLGRDDGVAAAQRVTSGGGVAAHRDPTSSAGVIAGPTWRELDLDPPSLQHPMPTRTRTVAVSWRQRSERRRAGGGGESSPGRSSIESTSSGERSTRSSTSSVAARPQRRPFFSWVARFVGSIWSSAVA